MTVTIVSSLMLMAGLFLMLWAGVALIQDNRFFSSAPKDVLAVIQPRKERFPGQHLLGWILGILSIVIMAGALVYAGWDGVRSGFTFRQFFTRFLVMLLALKAYDILFFDWFLLCHSGFFPHYYPEVKGVVGPHQFGYNVRDHLVMILLCPVISALLAWICISLQHPH